MFGPSHWKDGVALSSDEEAVSEVHAEGNIRGSVLDMLSLRHLVGAQVAFTHGSLTLQVGNPLT